MTTVAHRPASVTALRSSTALDPRRLRAAKFAYTTRHVAASVDASGEG